MNFQQQCDDHVSGDGKWLRSFLYIQCFKASRPSGKNCFRKDGNSIFTDYSFTKDGNCSKPCISRHRDL